ncbi:hypothetical protein RF11_09984 [Thelohanellus kitauei]|uniref:Uncharacterized protein n=1 Tax=Thelohanellus kitauei TaxID=669202 RepID=A0A0C2N376_THEKT|nr:hypothetical protein RF11_09984 [Thelohanellus kitauei]
MFIGTFFITSKQKITEIIEIAKGPSVGFLLEFQWRRKRLKKFGVSSYLRFDKLKTSETCIQSTPAKCIASGPGKNVHLSGVDCIRHLINKMDVIVVKDYKNMIDNH